MKIIFFTGFLGLGKIKYFAIYYSRKKIFSVTLRYVLKF